MAQKIIDSMDYTFTTTRYECSSRTEAVDYKQVAKDAITILGSKDIVVSLGWKLNTRGLNMKAGQFVRAGDITMTTEQILEKLQAQEGFKGFTDPKSSRIRIGKQVVTISRIARATAKIVILGIKAKKLDLGPDCMKIKETSGTALPDHFCFINAPYGMSDEEIKANAADFVKFLTAFQMEIDKAVTSGWVIPSSTKKRDYVKEFHNYIEFRGISM